MATAAPASWRRTAHPTALIIGMTVIYYLLDFIKDVYLYPRFGPGQLDPFYGAGTLLEAAVRVTMFAAISAAMMPVLAESLREGGDELAGRYSSSILLASVIPLSILTVAGVWLAPQILSLIYGFDPSAKAVLITRLVFAGLPLFAIDRIMRTLLEHRQQFGGPSATSVVARIVFLGVVFAIASSSGAASTGLASLLSAAAAAICILTLFHAGGWRLHKPLALTHPLMRRTWALLLPLGLAGAFTQTQLVERIFASQFASGSLSLLRLAAIIYDIPITLFCISIGTAVFPRMCEAAEAGNRAELQQHLATGFRRSQYFVLPSMFGLIALAYPLIAVFYQRGRFSADDAGLTAQAVIAYSVGLAAAGTKPVLSRALYAVRRHRLFLPIEAGTLIVTIALNYLFGIVLGWGLPGLALATAAASIASACVIGALTHRFIGFPRPRAIAAALLKMTLAALAMSAVCRLLARSIPPSLNPILSALLLLGIILLGAAIYIAITAFFRLDEFAHIRELFDKFIRRRKPGAPDAR